MDDPDTYPTPEAAANDAMEDILSARLIGVTYSDDGMQAIVEFSTNREPYLYPYYVECGMDENDKWAALSNHN